MHLKQEGWIVLSHVGVTYESRIMFSCLTLTGITMEDHTLMALRTHGTEFGLGKIIFQRPNKWWFSTWFPMMIPGSACSGPQPGVQDIFSGYLLFYPAPSTAPATQITPADGLYTFNHPRDSARLGAGRRRVEGLHMAAVTAGTLSDWHHLESPSRRIYATSNILQTRRLCCYFGSPLKLS